MAFTADRGSVASPLREPQRDPASLRRGGTAAGETAHGLTRQRVSACPEIDCVRGRLAPGLLAAAERRAQEVGCGADRVLIAAGLIEEEAYLNALSASLGVPYVPLETVSREAVPIPDDRVLEAAAAGLLPLKGRSGPVLAVAPRGLAARRLIDLMRARPFLRNVICLTGSESLRHYALRHARQAVAVQAADALRQIRPDLSAASLRIAPRPGRLAALSIVAMAGLAFPGQLIAGLSIVLSLVFLAWVALRLMGAAAPLRTAGREARLPDRQLPVYSIVVALYREARTVPQLVASLERLDYPREKLDIQFVLEPDDHETRAALARLGRRLPFEVTIAPGYGPRTKPKALNAALAFARGQYLAVYDAEDRPEPDQLRIALETFMSSGDDIACVQAALTIDNTKDSWLARIFTAEYAGLFDVFLPGLAHRHLPLPLGGSSNHFRTAVLRQVGAWDPFNVTEDADLGMRLARFGYRTGIVASTTYEEAPARLTPWLKQRTRWFKGWMQTWLVHMRSPVDLYRQLGPAGFVAFQLVVGGTVLASLVHPVFLGFAVAIVSSGGIPPGEGPVAVLLAGLFAFTFVSGYLTSAILGLLGLARRGLHRSAWVLLLMPMHWLLLSLAAWRALFQLVRDPHRWEKTDHGLARTSRLADRGRRYPS